MPRYERAYAALEESITLFRQIGDESGLAHALWRHAVLLYGARDAQQVRAICQEGLPLARKTGNLVATAGLLKMLGNESYFEGDYRQAEMLWEKALELDREIGNRMGVANVLGNLALGSLRQGHWQKARIRLTDSLVAYREMGRRDGIVACLTGFAVLAYGTAQAERAARLLGAVSALLEAPGFFHSPIFRVEYDRTLATVRDQLDEGIWQAAWNAGRAIVATAGQGAWEQAVAYALQEDHNALPAL
jgi:tetratricopeptide (TPR) repeat protein